MQRYPLTWPAGWKRTEPGRRTRAQFKKATRYEDLGNGAGQRYIPGRNLTMSEATMRCLGELRRMGVQDGDHVISTNVVLRLDGLPRSDQRAPADPGVALYWEQKGAKRCMAVDHYDRVEDNLAAIAATLEAMRAIERHGGAAILDRAFTGFTALPPPMAAGKPWREVFGYPLGHKVTRLELDGAYRTARSDAHPDKGGTSEAFQGVQQAYEGALRELGFAA